VTVQSSGPVPADALERPETAADDRWRLVNALAGQLGSRQEALWIVDHGGPARAQALADRRSSGEPLQYVLGRWSFRALDLLVDPRVLVPRPETEQVVEVALRELARADSQRHVADMAHGADGMDADAGPICVDLGTGSGAIALSMATEGGRHCPGLAVWATDVSDDALAVASENLGALARVDAGAAVRVRVAGGSWFDALPPELLGRVDLVVSNPPYVAESEYPGLDVSVRSWEPKLALVAADGAGGVGGMAAIEAIIEGAIPWLSRSGAVVIEIAPGQAEASLEVATRSGFDQVGVERDLSGRLRTLVARRTT
jgi:release factor glutamine methyltransferase